MRDRLFIAFLPLLLLIAYSAVAPTRAQVPSAPDTLRTPADTLALPSDTLRTPADTTQSVPDSLARRRGNRDVQERARRPGGAQNHAMRRAPAHATAPAHPVTMG